MMRTKLDSDTIDQLATGVAWLEGNGRIGHANPAFVEQTGYGLSRLLGQTLEVLKPDGKRLHAFAQQSWAEQGALALPGVTVCAIPGAEARLDFSFTPAGDGVWIETRPA